MKVHFIISFFFSAVPIFLEIGTFNLSGSINSMSRSELSLQKHHSNSWKFRQRNIKYFRTRKHRHDSWAERMTSGAKTSRPIRQHSNGPSGPGDAPHPHPGLALDRDGQDQGGLLGLVSCTLSASREAPFISADPLRRRGGGKGGGGWRTSWCLLLHFRQVWIIYKRVNEEFPAFITAAKSFKSVWICNIARGNCTKYNIYRSD